MRHKQIKLCTILFLGLGLTGLQAQTMYIKESGGTQTAYAVNTIRKMTFSSGNITVTKTDNSSGVYTLNDLRYLNFKELFTRVEEQRDAEIQSLRAFPNPVINQLHIDLRGMSNLNGTLSILNLQGRVMKTEAVIGLGIVSLDMSQFPTGIYLCRYSNGTEIKTVKIVKQ